jgi:hypothetical protein
MLEIGGGWLEKLVRFRLPNWDWQQGTGNREQGTGNREQGTGNKSPLGWRSAIKAKQTPTHLRRLLSMRSKEDGQKQTHREYLLTLQSLGVVLGPGFREKQMG